MGNDPMCKCGHTLRNHPRKCAAENIVISGVTESAPPQFFHLCALQLFANLTDVAARSSCRLVHKRLQTVDREFLSLYTSRVGRSSEVLAESRSPCSSARCSEMAQRSAYSHTGTSRSRGIHFQWNVRALPSAFPPQKCVAPRGAPRCHPQAPEGSRRGNRRRSGRPHCVVAEASHGRTRRHRQSCGARRRRLWHLRILREVPVTIRNYARLFTPE
jgi:hypothetical protein